MTEIRLYYDGSKVAQERGFWCGPASTQMILSGKGIARDERDLARELGTTFDGTAYVGLIEGVLNRYLPDAHYTSVYSPIDPEVLWRNLRSSMDAGYGVSINIDVPPFNYPRGVHGSPSPAYGGGEIFHYVAAMGYSDEGGRYVWIADSGFRPFGYWVALEQLATMIPPKGYAYATVQSLLIPGVEGLYI